MTFETYNLEILKKVYARECEKLFHSFFHLLRSVKAHSLVGENILEEKAKTFDMYSYLIEITLQMQRA